MSLIRAFTTLACGHCGQDGEHVVDGEHLPRLHLDELVDREASVRHALLHSQFVRLQRQVGKFEYKVGWYVYYWASRQSLGFEDEDLGSSPVWWAGGPLL